ncbi:matrixin family metalloprotease [Arthrobacter caoxuetaonis]|uniref:Matrixin family metalloprotease n=1 Tax=Arthrobacter caoxuetaonis TaxID=2886935 RepID=A0A9X1MIX4_9MICC|nr:matrixin family metalloprotease [Arthrobacter caoxuetaonis]MCC3299797.1 matrixin family metalloprotease [Arthrobacter caoxuetaonis]USQ59303.1 matrixin family metalloprotease [Arthrobacter caoxuetaonis]
MSHEGPFGPFDPYQAPVPRPAPVPVRPRRSFGDFLAGAFRFLSFLVMSVLVVGLSGIAMMLLAPDTAAKVMAYAPPSWQLPQAPGAEYSPDLLGPAEEPPAVPDLKDPVAGTGPEFVPADPDQTRPTPGREASDTPLGKPAPLPAIDNRYKLLRDGTAYDPCRPIHYVTNTDNMPPGGRALIAEAVAEVSRATGLVFIDDGLTTEPASAERRAFQPERYGDRWAPVLFIWKTEAQQPRFTNTQYGTNTVGIGGSVAYTLEGTGSVYVTGEVQLNAAALSEDLQKPGGATSVRSVIAHELGHVVGLDHVEDTSQLMAPTSTDEVTSFGPGDLNGLAKLGQGICIPEL